jgi:hypothetical protein
MIQRMDAPLTPIFYIYGLIDPSTKELRYIGKAQDLFKRLASHLREAFRLTRPVNLWIKKCAIAGELPEVCVLKITADWEADERKEIAAARAAGCPILNLASGGSVQGLKRVAPNRPKHIMRVYRMMEQTIRQARLRGELEHVARLETKYGNFKRAVARHRKHGTLADLDRRLGERRMLG